MDESLFVLASKIIAGSVPVSRLSEEEKAILGLSELEQKQISTSGIGMDILREKAAKLIFTALTNMQNQINSLIVEVNKLKGL